MILNGIGKKKLSAENDINWPGRGRGLGWNSSGYKITWKRVEDILNLMGLI